MENKMKVEIWSDIMCPFCYIGKRKFESALGQFQHRDNVEIVWRSFQLDPTVQPQDGKDVYTYLAERRGQSRDWSVKMHQSVVAMAKEVGLEYNFDKAKITNSYDAHRVIQLAKQHGLGDAMEERLFKAYFTEGEQIADHQTLARLAAEVGIRKDDVINALAQGSYNDAVARDIQEAQQIGVNGVPFFVLDRRYAVSGAQDPAAFLGALQKAFEDWQTNNTDIVADTAEGAACSVYGCS
jgi:predicted DsbA family dithiol-disulfide isomerase